MPVRKLVLLNVLAICFISSVLVKGGQTAVAMVKEGRVNPEYLSSILSPFQSLFQEAEGLFCLFLRTMGYPDEDGNLTPNHNKGLF
jgi:hypothetical protein